MKLVKVKELPKASVRVHDLQAIIQEFVNSDSRISKLDIDDHDYKSVQVCYNVMCTAVRRSRHPVKVHIRKGNVYLEKI